MSDTVAHLQASISRLDLVGLPSASKQVLFDCRATLSIQPQPGYQTRYSRCRGSTSRPDVGDNEWHSRCPSCASFRYEYRPVQSPFPRFHLCISFPSLSCLPPVLASVYSDMKPPPPLLAIPSNTPYLDAFLSAHKQHKMARPPITSPPPPATPPTYGSITPSPDIESQRQSLVSPLPPPCHACGNSKPIKDPRGWIHAILGLQGARDPKYNEEEFQAAALFFLLVLVAIIGLTLVVIFVPGAGASIGTCLIFLGVVIVAFTAFPSPWCGQSGSCRGFLD